MSESDRSSSEDDEPLSIHQALSLHRSDADAETIQNVNRQPLPTGKKRRRSKMSGAVQEKQNMPGADESSKQQPKVPGQTRGKHAKVTMEILRKRKKVLFAETQNVPLEHACDGDIAQDQYYKAPDVVDVNIDEPSDIDRSPSPAGEQEETVQHPPIADDTSTLPEQSIRSPDGPSVFDYTEAEGNDDVYVQEPGHDQDIQTPLDNWKRKPLAVDSPSTSYAEKGRHPSLVSMSTPQVHGRRRSVDTDSTKSSGGGSLWLRNAKEYLPLGQQVEQAIIDESGKTITDVEQAYDPFKEADIMNFFIGKYMLDILELELSKKQWWDREVDQFLVDRFVYEMMLNPKLLMNSNAVSVVLLASRMEFANYKRQVDFGKGIPFSAYFRGRLVLVGAKIRFQAATQIHEKHPGHFDSLFREYNTYFTILPCNVFIHDKYDPTDTITDSLIIKVASCSNLENPGSGPLLIPDQIWIARKLLFEAGNKPIPRDPHLTVLPSVYDSFSWRHSVWNILKGASGATFAEGRGQLEPLLQFSKRSVVVMTAFYEFIFTLQKKISELSAYNYTRTNLITGYQLGADGFNNMDDELVLEVFDRCMAVLTNRNYSFGTLPNIKKLLGSDCGIVYFCRLLKMRSSLITYALGRFGHSSLDSLQEAYPDWFSEEKLEHLCQDGASPGPVRRSKAAKGRPPKLPPVIKNHVTVVPYKWKAHCDAADRYRQRRVNTNSIPETDDRLLGFQDESGAYSSVLFYTEDFSLLARSSVQKRIGGNNVVWGGFDASVLEVTALDATEDFARLDGILSQTVPLRQVTHHNWLFVGDLITLQKLSTWLQNKMPIISAVQEVGYYRVKSRKCPGQQDGANQTFSLDNPLKPFLIAHYSSTGALTSENLDMQSGPSGFVNRKSMSSCLEQIIRWICPRNGWAFSVGLCGELAVACTRSGINLLLCTGTSDRDDLTSLRNTYGEWRNKLMNDVSTGKVIGNDTVSTASSSNNVDEPNPAAVVSTPRPPTFKPSGRQRDEATRSKNKNRNTNSC